MATAPLTRAAATWRATVLITEDELTRPLREAVNRRWPDSRAAYLIQCPACVSVWAGFATLLLPRWATRALALSASTILVNEVRDHIAARALTARMAASGVRQGESAEVQRP